jgi:tagatose-6-phosphate ketose/aldose isomerase
MTSSFTNMAVAGQALAATDGAQPAFYVRLRLLAALAREILLRRSAELARVAAGRFRLACFLGAGAQLGAAREAALKMLEMSGGGVSTIVDTPLGLRHGPMAALRDDTLVVAGVPASRRARGYALDVLREIDRKRLAGSRVIIGDALPDDLLNEGDVGVVLAGYNELDDGLAAVLDVLVGQILAFFRCLAGGLRPDAPSPDAVISRVVPHFPLYR